MFVVQPPFHPCDPIELTQGCRTAISTSVRDASDFVDLCRLYGYEAEEHVLQTKDGYLLGLHRLAWKKGEEGQRVNSGPGSLKKKAIYLHHGLLMNSEVWVCLTDEQRCLPFVLAEKGYDVWVSVPPRIRLSIALMITLAWQQSRQQILEKVGTSFPEVCRVLELLHR